MGIQYYLARDDNRTLFELGKGAEWREVFQVSDAPLADRILRTLAVAGWGWDSLTPKWCAEVAHKIEAWAEGQPYVFIAEYDRRVEVDYDEVAYRRTGSRFKED